MINGFLGLKHLIQVISWELLSGGNMQKVILARELEADPDFLIAAQPTRGVDIGAIESIHHKLVEVRDSGRGILLVSARIG